jgi:hypothetical protein
MKKIKIQSKINEINEGSATMRVTNEGNKSVIGSFDSFAKNAMSHREYTSNSEYSASRKEATVTPKQFIKKSASYFESEKTIPKFIGEDLENYKKISALGVSALTDQPIKEIATAESQFPKRAEDINLQRHRDLDSETISTLDARHV